MTFWTTVAIGLLIAIVFIVVLAFFRNRRFHAKVLLKECLYLLGTGQSAATQKPIANSDLEHLPSCVRSYLRYAGVVGKKPTRFIRLRQTAKMTAESNGPWIDLNSVQYATAEPISFLWYATSPLVKIVGITLEVIDMYVHDAGQLLVNLFPFGIRAMDLSGYEIDYSQALRALGSICWIPTAFLSPRLRWTEVDDEHATCTMHTEQFDASMDFFFNEQGQLIKTMGERYFTDKQVAKPVKRMWGVNLADYFETSAGFVIPRRIEAFWLVDNKDKTKKEKEQLVYFTGTINEIDYDVMQLYKH